MKQNQVDIRTLFTEIDNRTVDEKMTSIVKLLGGIYSELVTIRKHWDRFDSRSQTVEMMMISPEGIA